VTVVHFDADGFTAALDSTRQARKFSWRKVADEAGVSASTLTRLSQGKRPDVDSLGALAYWAGLNIGNYYVGNAPTLPVEPLAQIGAFLRADPNLGEEGAKALEAILRVTYDQLRLK
jgi:transcriptional regulator with XRE-family HTH domain